MPADSRYNKAKRTKNNNADEVWFAPAMWGDKRAEVCQAAANSVDKIARNLENKWGIGKLQELATPNLAVKFEQARQNFSDAINGNDVQYLVSKANNLIDGWKALERYALKNGFKPGTEEVWYAIAPEDQGEYKFAIVKHAADTAAVDRTKYPRVYTLDEIARIINAFETPTIQSTKENFPNSTITKIGGTNDKEQYNDPIPF